MPVNPNEAPEGYEAVESNGCDGECAFEYRSKECLSVASVSYTHLTLPTSDLV